MIALIDYCAGNLRNVKRALDFLEIENQITNSPEEVIAADAIIIPGVGAAGTAMSNLREVGLVEVLQKEIPKKPYLGICLGLQILFEKSSEDESECLGIFKGSVQKINSTEVKIPHIGWNPVEFSETPKILTGIENNTPFYFVHSYFAEVGDSEIVKASTQHGITFPAVINREKIWGLQFHPEKSGEVGLQVLRNFAKLLA